MTVPQLNDILILVINSEVYYVEHSDNKKMDQENILLNGFIAKSQTPEWISFAHKADELRENFINLFWNRTLKITFGKRFVNFFIL